MLKGVGKITIDVNRLVNVFDRSVYKSALIMSKGEINIENTNPNVGIEKMYIEDLEDVNYLVDVFNRIRRDKLIIELNYVSEEDLISNSVLHELIHVIELAIWDNEIIKDIRNINKVIM